MIDINEINNTIEELENQRLTFDICGKLADLYTIKKYYEPESDITIKEYNDILPSYNKFCEIKRRYQLSEISEDAVYKQLELLCIEVSEFIHTLYNNTDSQKERDMIKIYLKGVP